MRGLTDYVLAPLTFIGAINWGLVGIFGFDLVAWLFGPATLVSNIVYAIIGIAAVVWLIIMFIDKLLRCILCCPLKRSVGLRHEVGNAGSDSEPAAFATPYSEIDIYDILGDLTDAVQIFISLSRKPCHEVQLDSFPSKSYRLLYGTVYIFFCYILIDDVSKSLTACFRCKSQSGLSVSLDLIENFERERVKPERR